jgi:hypothetical protein
MKKLITAVALLVTFSLTAQQDKKLTQYGGRAAINFASYTDDENLVSTKGIIGGAVGFVYLKNIEGKKYSIQAELNLSMQGAKLQKPGVTVVQRTTYIQLPFMITGDIGSKGKFQYLGGPSLGVLLSSKNKAGTTTTDSKKDVSKVDVGFVLGSNYKLTDNFGVNLRWNIGFTDVSKDKNLKYQNNIISGGVYYIF